MNKRRAFISTVLTMLLVGMAAWAFGFFGGPDPAVAELQKLGDQMWDNNMPEAQRNQLRNDFRQRMESMTEAQRRAFFDANRESWSGRMEQRMDEYFAMSKTDQQKRLDEILNRMVQSRTAATQSPNGQQVGGVGGGSQSASGGPGGRGDRRSMTDAERQERSKKRLDRSTPKMRAQTAEFRKQLEVRAQQRGIPIGDPRGRGGFGNFPRGV